MLWRIAVVEEEAKYHQYDERDVRDRRQRPDQVQADRHADRCEEVERREVERARQLGGVAAELDQPDKDDEECRKNTGVRELNDVEHRHAACDERDERRTDERDEVRRAILRMDVCHRLREETVTRHSKEDACLTEDVNDEGRDHTEEDANRDEVCETRVADEAQAVGDRICAIEIRVGDRRREDECHNGVDAEADKDRCDDADRETLLRRLALLGGGCDRIESHEGEEHDRCACHDAAGTEREERIEVRRYRMGRRDNNVGDNRAQRERDEDRVETRALLRTVSKDDADDKCDDNSGQIDDTALRERRKECLRYLHAEGCHHPGEVGGESDGNRTRGDDVADDQRPSAEERHALTEGGKRIGVCAARRRDERCQLCVGETDEHTEETCCNKGKNNTGPRIACRTNTGQNEHARANDAADAKEGQIHGAQRSDHTAVLTLGTEVFQCFFLKKHKVFTPFFQNIVKQNL